MSIVHIKMQSPFKILTDFSKIGQKHEKWEELYILAFEEFFRKLKKNNYGGARDFDIIISNNLKFLIF